MSKLERKAKQHAEDGGPSLEEAEESKLRQLKDDLQVNRGMGKP